MTLWRDGPKLVLQRERSISGDSHGGAVQACELARCVSAAFFPPCFGTPWTPGCESKQGDAGGGPFRRVVRGGAPKWTAFGHELIEIEVHDVTFESCDFFVELDMS